jgi:hypothetical protein
MFWDSAKPLIMNYIKAVMQRDNLKFPIVLQNSIKVIGIYTGKPEYDPIYRAARTDSVSNLKYVANNFEQVEKLLEQQLDELASRLDATGEGSDLATEDIISYHVRFWEYRPSVIRRATSIFARSNGFIETPE